MLKQPPFIKSIQYALRGLAVAYKAERSFRFQVLAAILVIVVVFIFPLQTWERSVLLLVAMSVLVLELLNSSVERMVDLVKPRLHEYVADIKDIMAGAVLLAALFALLLAVIILGPHVMIFIRSL